jgi:hypothetical protein
LAKKIMLFARVPPLTRWKEEIIRDTWWNGSEVYCKIIGEKISKLTLSKTSDSLDGTNASLNAGIFHSVAHLQSKSGTNLERNLIDLR